MVHARRLAVASIAVAFTAGAGACGSPPAVEAPSAGSRASAASTRAPEYPTDEHAWGKFHSKRFQVTIPLPDGHAWKIDDHHGPELVAVHLPTDSRLVVVATQEDELMNRQRCSEKARARGWFDERKLDTVEDRVQVGPDAYDSRVWVAVDATSKKALVGHVFLFGAFLRQCLLVHLTTTVPSRDDESVLATRLAVGGARIAGGITVDPLRTTDSATVPRDKPTRSGTP